MHSATKFRVLVQTQEYILRANFDPLDQKVRSPIQVKVSCAPRDQHQPPVSWCEHSFSLKVFEAFRMRYLSQYIQNVFIWVPILVTSDQVNFRPDFTLLPITFEAKAIDEYKWYRSAYLVAPNRMIPNTTNFDLTWHVNSKLVGRSGQYFDKITPFVLTREARWYQSRYSRINT